MNKSVYIFESEQLSTSVDSVGSSPASVQSSMDEVCS